jgi:hypothetical protein
LEVKILQYLGGYTEWWTGSEAVVSPQVRKTLVYENLTGPSLEQTDPSHANSTPHQSSPPLYWSQARSPPSQTSDVSWPQPTYGIFASNIITIVFIIVIIIIIIVIIIFIIQSYCRLHENCHIINKPGVAGAVL